MQFPVLEVDTKQHYMPRTIILIMLLFISCILLAQTTFDVGLSLYPSISNRRLIAFSNISEAEQNRLDSIEMNRLSYGIGLTAGWKGGKAGLQLGINYMNTGYRTIKEAIPPDDPQSEQASNRRFSYQNTNLEVPVDVQFFQEVSPGNEFFFAMGTVFSFNLQNKNQVILFSGESKTRAPLEINEDDFRFFNYAFQAGMGWEKTFSERFALVVQPNFQFWFRGVLENNELNRSLYNFGLRIVAKYKSLPLRVD